MKDQWLGMESAPKDGTIVLLSRGSRVVMGRWNDEKYRKKPEGYWETYSNFNSVRRDKAQTPSAWMSLPNSIGVAA